MSDQQKSDLQWKVRYLLGDGQPNSKIIETLEKMGFRKADIKKEIKDCSK